MKITLLGTGSPEANADRASSGYLVEITDDVIWFDCGGGVVDRLLQSGRQPSDITHLVFTHLHSDHMIDYARLIHAAWDEGGEAIQVYGPTPIGTVHERLFGRDGALAFDLIARTELEQSQQVWVDRGGTLPRPWPAPVITEIQAGDSIEGRDWVIKSATAAHAQPLLDCLGFRLEHQGNVFVYSGDTAITPDIEALSQDADLLLHWCYRLDDERLHPALDAMSPSPREIGAMARRAQVKRLVLTHFRTHMDTPDKRATALANIDAPPASIAQDLMVIEL
ncbi:MAG: MBL fold metallo-hydrolase [Pseudomonadota bacterium]